MSTIKSLFGSKKFVAMLAGVAVYLASRFGFDVAQSDAENVLALVGLYIGGQSLADVGKEAAKLKAFDPTEPAK